MRTCTCKRYGKWRRYTTAKGYWGLGVNRSPDKHWSAQVGKWVYTTSPCSDADAEPAPEKPKSRFRKALASQNIIRVLWGLLGAFDLYNGTMAAVFYHRPVQAGIDLFAAAWMFLIAWDSKRTTGWIAPRVVWVLKRIVTAWKYAAPLVVTAVTVPYERLSDRYGLYGKTLRMRARIRRLKHKVTRR